MDRVQPVEILWMNRAFPVQGLTELNLFPPTPLRIPRAARMCKSLRPLLRLIFNAAGVQFTTLSILQTHADVSTVDISVHRFEELIGGHPYLIEVAAVATDRWRACIVRIPGGPIALMPFYGPTPVEAASRLRQWLTRAHEPARRTEVVSAKRHEDGTLVPTGLSDCCK
jgi:hypothetical protein